MGRDEDKFLLLKQKRKVSVDKRPSLNLSEFTGYGILIPGEKYEKTKYYLLSGLLSTVTGRLRQILPGTQNRYSDLF
jgi:hypothetical protein